ncbi:MAG: hypothetical protein APR63_08960 [Desulfuromonas sp. SDB]|nr:MAG: hypothetical protein APR63_08960 [Desulfuromonas sp. SDB]
MNPDQITSYQQLMVMITSKWISKSIYAAAKLGIADILSEKSANIDEIAELTGTQPAQLYRLLRALSSMGVFNEESPAVFSINTKGECLKTGNLRAAALLFNSEWSDQSWGKLMQTLKTGKTSFELAHNQDLNSWLKDHPEYCDIFNQANSFKVKTSFFPAIRNYDFSDCRKITDIGGGVGTLLIEILLLNPHLRGIVADKPGVVEIARQKIKSHHLTGRCKTIKCDFFRQIPGGSDVYLLANILHDWPDEKCLNILKNCYRDLNSRAKLLVLEFIIPPGNKPSVSKLLDLEMMVTTGGKERTALEYRQLFQEGGFKVLKIVNSPTEVSIMELIKEI